MMAVGPRGGLCNARPSASWRNSSSSLPAFATIDPAGTDQAGEAALAIAADPSLAPCATTLRRHPQYGPAAPPARGERAVDGSVRERAALRLGKFGQRGSVVGCGCHTAVGQLSNSEWALTVSPVRPQCKAELRSEPGCDALILAARSPSLRVAMVELDWVSHLVLRSVGASVVVAGRSSTKNDTAVEELTRIGVVASGIVVDVTIETECQAMVAETVKRYGRLDILVITPASATLTRRMRQRWLCGTR